MTMNKKSKSIIAVYGILALIYLIIFVVIPFPKNAASWISFVFTLLSFVISLGITMYAFGGDGDITSKFYGFPIFKIAYLYPTVQFIVGVLLCLVAAFVAVPYWVALTISLLILGAAAIGVIATDNVRDMIEATEVEEELVTKASKMFHLNIASVLDRCEDAETRKELEKLAELIRFSDPVSGEETEEIEMMILEKLDNLKLNISSASTEDSKTAIAELENLMNERNRICKASKK